MRRSIFVLGAALGATLVLTGAAEAQFLGGQGGLGGGLGGGFGPGGLSGGLSGSAMGAGALGHPGLGSRLDRPTGRLQDTANQTRDRAARAKAAGVATAQTADRQARGGADAAAIQAQSAEAQGRAAGDVAAARGLGVAGSARGMAPAAGQADGGAASPPQVTRSSALGSARGTGDLSQRGLSASGTAQGSAATPY